MQPNGEHNQQGPSGPPNFPPPGGGYTKPGPFSGPNQTRNLLMMAAAVVLLVAVVVVAAVSCSGGSTDDGASSKARERTQWTGQDLVQVLNKAGITGCYVMNEGSSAPNSSNNEKFSMSGFTAFAWCDHDTQGKLPQIGIGISSDPNGSAPIGKYMATLAFWNGSSDAEKQRCYITDGYSLFVSTNIRGSAAEEEKVRSETLAQLQKVLDDVKIKCDAGVAGGL